MAASVKSRRACGPSFVFLAKARSWDALKSPRNDTGIAMTNLHRSPPMNQSKTDLRIVNESQLLRFGINHLLDDFEILLLHDLAICLRRSMSASSSSQTSSTMQDSILLN